MDRLKEYWWAIGVVTFLAGALSTGFVRFTVYYLAEQSSVASLSQLTTNSQLVFEQLKAINGRLDVHDRTLDAQNYANQANAQARADTAEHLHALDQRADIDRDNIAAMDKLLGKHDQSLLFLLDNLNNRSGTHR